MQTFICPACGHRSTFDPFVASARCPACGYDPLEGDRLRHRRSPTPARPSPRVAAEIDRLATGVSGDAVTRIYNAAKEDFPDHVLLARLDDHLYTFGHDARMVIDTCGPDLQVDEAFESVQPPTARLPFAERQQVVDQVAEAGHRVGIIRYGVLTCPKCGHRNRTADVYFPSYECATCGYVPPERDQLMETFLKAGIEATEAGDLQKAQAALNMALEHGGSPNQRATALLWLAQATPNLSASQQYLEHALTLSPSEAVAAAVRDRLAQVDAVLEERGSVAASSQRLSQSPAGDGLGSVAAERFACPHCGGGVRYDPDERRLACQHCGYRQPVRRARASGRSVAERPFLAAMASLKGHPTLMEVRTFECTSCGASFLLAPAALSLICPYCSSAYAVEEAALEAVIPPDGLIPFAVSRGEAEEALSAWWADRPAPQEVVPPTGVYLPVWTFDVTGMIDWSCEVLVGWSMVRLSRYAWRRGLESVFYDDVLIPASSKWPLAQAEVTDGFDLGGLVPYHRAYLADWPAGVQDIAMSDAAIDARKQAVERFEAALGGAYGEIKEVRLRTGGLRVETYKLILLPIWIAHCTWGGAPRAVLINGQQGTVRGPMLQ